MSRFQYRSVKNVVGCGRECREMELSSNEAMPYHFPTGRTRVRGSYYAKRLQELAASYALSTNTNF